MVGMVGGGQNIKLTHKRKCAEKPGLVMHEILHALGFNHMHTHTDRDKFIKIYWDNISEKMKKNFAKHRADKVSSFGTKYDFFSIMHYPPRNAKGVMIAPKKDYKYYQQFMGQRKLLSTGDIKRLNEMYQCDIDDDYNVDDENEEEEEEDE